MRKQYPSDVSRAQFEQIKPLLSSARKSTRPRQVDLYDVLCGLLYLLKSGCQWNMIPSDFPHKSTIHYYFKLWKHKPTEEEPSLLEQALKKVGWRNSYVQWSEREDIIHHRGRAEREEHRDGDE